MANGPSDKTSADEYWAARRAVGLVDRRDWGVLELTGRDRATFLHALLSNEIKALAPGQGCAATLLDIHGKVQVVLLAWVLEDRILLVTPPGAGASTLEALDKYLFAEQVAVSDVSAASALFLLAGPDVPALVERLAGATPDARPWASGASRVDGVDPRLAPGGGPAGAAQGPD